MKPKFGYKCKCKAFLDIFQGMRICYTLGFMTFVWHFLEACPGFIHYMFSLAYFPNFVWRNLAKNRTKEKSFTLSPMALNLKLLPVSFGVNMCETTSSHVQYVDDVWCMFSHFGQALQTRKNATRSSQEHWQNQTDLVCAFQNHSKTVYMHAHPALSPSLSLYRLLKTFSRAKGEYSPHCRSWIYSIAAEDRGFYGEMSHGSRQAGICWSGPLPSA